MCLFLILKIRLWLCVGAGVCITLLSFLTVWKVSFIFVSLGQEQYFSGSGCTLNVDYTKG